MTAGGHLADPGVELHLVTGKGGTGKTTVAAALALALASQGRTVLLVEVEGRQGLAQLFELPPLPYVETAVGMGGLHLLAVEPKEALREYLQMYYRLGPAMGLLDRFGAVDFVTTIAPGLRDVLLTGKIYEAVGDRRRGRRRYDAVVVDCPPTGRIGRFLNINAEVSDLAKMGPVHSQATSIMSLMASPRTAIHLVTLAEEMPVTETLDGIEELTAAGLRIGVIVANRLRTSPLDTDEAVRIGERRLPASRVTTALRAAGLDSPELPAAQLSVALLGEADDLLSRLALQTEQMQRLTDSGRTIVQLPELTDGGTLDGVGRLAGLLAGTAGS
jgi:anion-transporting  ArsA/GET3 family ATPase